MFREMRRAKQELTLTDCQAILKKNNSGVLALNGDAGYPYAVPLSYVFADGKVIFHSALSGHKLDAIANNDKASFCVIDADNILPEKLATAYRSVIIFGHIRIIHDDAEKRRALWLIGEKYSTAIPSETIQAEIESKLKFTAIIELSIEHLSGKCSQYLLPE